MYRVPAKIHFEFDWSRALPGCESIFSSGCQKARTHNQKTSLHELSKPVYGKLEANRERVFSGARFGCDIAE